MKKIHNDKKGFTLNALISVVVLVITLSSIVLPCMAASNIGTENGHYNNQLIERNEFFDNSFSVLSAKKAAALKPSFDETFNTFLSDPRWKAGASWGTRSPYISSCKSWSGCAAYCCDYTKFVNGIDNPRSGNIYYNIGDIRRGDVVRIGPNSNQHWFVVVERNGNKLKVAERSSSKIKVGWNYTINTSKNRFNEDGRTFQYAWHYTDKRTNISVPSTPAKVSGLKVTKTTKTSISLTWNKVSGSNIKYEIYADGKCIATTTGTTYTQSGLKAYTCHTYQVRATVTYYGWDYNYHTLYGQYSIGLIAFTKKK